MASDLFSTSHVAPTLENALRALAARDTDHASVDNGIGFNGSDSKWGNRLAFLIGQGRLKWRDEAEYVEARARLVKYTKQLAAYGIDVNAIPAAPAPGTMRASVGAAPAEQLAKVDGRCSHCGGRIPVGSSFKWGSGRGERVHVGDCTPQEPTTAIAPAPVRTPSAPQPSRSTITLEQSDNTGPASVLGPGGLIAQKLEGYQSRPSQLKLAEACAAAMRQGTNLVAEAPTGTGKSLAYAVPVAQERRKTIISTAIKSLQEQLANKDLPFLSSAVPFTYAVLKGRSNYLCLLRANQVEERAQEWLFSDVAAFKTDAANAQWDEIQPLLKEPGDGDLENWPLNLAPELKQELTVTTDECLARKCPFFKDCLVEKAKARAKASDVIVVNHSLLLRDLQLRAMTDGLVSVLPDTHDTLILDEAHHLEEQATEAFATEVSLARWLRLKKRIDQLAASHKAVQEAEKILASGSVMTEGDVGAIDIAHRGADWAERLTGADAGMSALFGLLELRLRDSGLDAQRIGDVWEPHGVALVKALGDLALVMADQMPSWLEEKEQAQWERLASSADKLSQAILTLTMRDVAPDPSHVRFCQMEGNEEGRRLVLYAKPIDVSDILRTHLWGATVREKDEDGEWLSERAAFRSVIAVSATIATDSGFRYWRERVGLDHAAELQVSSPFDFPRIARTYVPQDADAFDPTHSTRGQLGEVEIYFDTLAERTYQLVKACSIGGAFLLFTSNKALNAIYLRIGGKLELEGRTVLKQGMDTRPRLLERFKQDGHAVLFGVKSWWEGIDVQGDALALVVIDKMPFNPPTDPVWDAKCRAIDRKAGREFAWFNELALPTAIIALKQGYGRLIRRDTDRGVVALLDGRLGMPSKRYGTRVLAALPPAKQVRTIEEVVRFYATAPTESQEPTVTTSSGDEGWAGAWSDSGYDF